MKKQILSFTLISLISIYAISLFLNANDSQKKAFPKTKIDRITLDYFNEIAFDFEYKENIKESNPTLKKWEKSVVSIALKGDRLNPYLNNCLENVISDFNALSSTTKLEIGDGRDIDFYLTPIEEFSTLIPEYIPGNYGYFYLEFNENNAIFHSTVLVNSNDPSKDIERCHLIREELTQSMGFPRDSDKYEDSIFYEPWSNVLSYSNLDKELIKLLYSTGLNSGMTQDEVNSRFILE